MPMIPAMTAHVTRCALVFLAVISVASAADSVHADCTLWIHGGGIAGCGVLAHYNAPGPQTLTVTRDTTPSKNGDLPPITIVAVIDPTGHTVMVSDLTDHGAQDRVDLAIPKGPAGIWRFSVEGGRTKDRVSFIFPSTPSWGIRGEMALGAAPDANGREGWLWIPTGTTEALIEALGGGSGGGEVHLTDAAGGDLPGAPESGHPAGKRTLWRWKNLPIGTAIHLTSTSTALAFDGIPGLLCPDAAAAADLAGGTVTVAGRTVDGPLQARARAWMVKAVKTDLEPHLVFPSSVPPLRHPLADLQLYGAYGPLSGLRAVCATQILDPNSVNFGSLGDGGDDHSLNGPNRTPFDAIGLASAIAADPEVNPAHGNPALVKRATLMAFYHLAGMQGDDLLREGDLSGNGYPMTHAFFVYEGSIAGPLPLIQPYLDPEAAAIWRDGVIAIGDRLADHHGYQTNQWFHVVLALLDTYRATGEPRFKTWFERQLRQILERPAESKATFGQAAAGYFIEDGGPDGNYDAISGTCLITALHEYEALPDADRAVVKMMQESIARDLAFSSCHWLPQPDGVMVGPTAMVTRKTFSFANQGWPGTKLARDEFPLAAAQWLLTPLPAKGLGMANLFPHFVNDDEWARRALDEFVPIGDAKLTDAKRGVPSAWTSEAIRAAEAPVAKPAVIPCREAHGRWDLPGQFAWKQGALYGLTFYNAPVGLTPTEACRMGGAPSALWSAKTGAFLLSQHNPHFEDNSAVGNNGVADPDDCTFACVFGRVKGAWWATGHERGTFTDHDGTVTISGSALKGGDADNGAAVTWTYAIQDNRLDLTVVVAQPDLEAPVLNLPFLCEIPGATVTVAAPGSAVFHGGGDVAITWDGKVDATVTAPLTTGSKLATSYPVACLRIPLAAFAEGWTRTVSFSVMH